MPNKFYFMLVVFILWLSFLAFNDAKAEEFVQPKQLECLAMNIYHEARNQPIEGQTAVAYVTLNRVMSNKYPDSICEVVWQRNWSNKYNKWVAQFSWTLDGKPDTAYNIEAWMHALDIAALVYINYGKDGRDPTKGATHYHANYVNPSWSKHLVKTSIIEDHIFYKRPKSRCK